MRNEPESDDYPPSDASERIKQHICQTYGLDDEGLKRVAVFLLAHVLVDTRLIRIALSAKRLSEGPGPSREKLADKAAQGTFLTHLRRAADTRWLPDDAKAFAKKLNQARDDLLHCEGDLLEFSPPVYKGLSVATDAGFRACMSDVLRFLDAIPFSPPIYGDPKA